MMKLAKKIRMNVTTTAWLTASPTPFGPALGVEALVAGDHGGDEAEHERLDQRRPQVGQLHQDGEALRSRRPAVTLLDDDVEEVAAGDARPG